MKNVTGLDETIKNFRALARLIGPAANTASKRSLEPMLATAKELVPVRTGRLCKALIIRRETLPETLAVTATTEDGLIMAVEHKSRPLYGVQFHPESIASENGHAILQNFLNIARDFNTRRAA